MSINIGIVVALIFFLPVDMGTAKKTESHQQEADKCLYWQSRVDPSIQRPKSIKTSDLESDQSIINGMECLLKLQGNKNKSIIEGATSPYASQTFGAATVEVSALYYISYLYYRKWDHALAASLMSNDRTADDPYTISSAYDAYRDWLKGIKKIGLAKARERHIDPLQGTGIRWY
jgi:hypothetical protein